MNLKNLSIMAVATAALYLTAALPAHADDMPMHEGGMDSMPMHGDKADMGEMHAMTTAEVRKIDREAGKITLKHGEIMHMGMPPMTMVFRVKDMAILEGIAEGDKVEFDVIQDQGQMVVTQLKKLP